MLIESRALIEPQRGFIFSASEQHDLVAILAPGFAESMREDCLAPSLATVRGMSDNILYHAIRAASAREVRNDSERAARNE